MKGLTLLSLNLFSNLPSTLYCRQNTGFTLAALTALSLSAALPAAAQTTIYSYQADNNQGTSYTGAGAAGDANFQRTIYQSTTSSGFYTYANSSEGATFAYDGNAFFPGGGGAASDNALLSTFDAVQQGAVGSISLTGFTADTPFTAYFYGVNGQYAGDGRNTTFTLASTNGAASAFTTETQDASFSNGVNYVTLTGTTDANGAINATYFGSRGNEGDINGAQFVVGPRANASAAPEPSQVGMLALASLGLGGLILRAKRRAVSVSSAA